MRTLKFYFTALSLVFFVIGFSQGVAISTNVAQPDNSAMLDVNSNSKGILIPRLSSSQRTGISPAATGLLVYDTDSSSFFYYNGTAWKNLSSSGPQGTTGATGPTGPTGAAGNQQSLFFPEGYSGMTIVTQNVNSSTGYTVPAGQDLYITAYSSNNLSGNLIVGPTGTTVGTGTVVTVSPSNQGASAPGLKQPVVFAPGSVVSSSSVNTTAFQGFTVPASGTITPVTLTNLSTTPYTVPVGKTLYILQYYCTGNNGVKLSIDGIVMFTGGYNNGSGGIPFPVFAASGKIVSCNNDAEVIYGYLQ